MSICGVIVIYNCDIEDILHNVDSVYRQVDHLLIVDNSEDNIREGKFREHFNNISFYFNGNHYGIAGALNYALKFAQSHGYDYLLTMDQDSRLEDDSVKELLNLLIENNLAMIGPNVYKKYGSGNVSDINLLITSGSLVNVEIADKIGGFNNDLFIDLVDLEFCLRMKQNGYKYGFARDIKMSHNIGEQRVFKRFGITKKMSYHSANRYYYIFRNNIIVRKLYRKYSPSYSLKLWIASLINRFNIMFYPKNERVIIKENIKRSKKDAKVYLAEA